MPATSLILGIESSCDETSVAVVRDGHQILANLVASQVELHRRFGGVVPEVASRQHILTLNPLLREALQAAGVGFSDLTAVAGTHAPGLMGALLVGLVGAKSAAWALGVPFVGVHHLAAHIWANVIADPSLPLPLVCLLVSGGHTALVRVNGPRDFVTLGETIDDAVGEAYDKTARLLDLPYPGGPHIDRLAAQGDPRAFAFPRALLHEPGFRFSLSGLKTAVRKSVEKQRLAGLPLPVADVAASFQAAVVDVLVAKTLAATETEGLTTVALAGGVAANGALRRRLAEACAARGWRLSLPPMELCTDNAAMIAGLAHALLATGEPDPLWLAPQARLALPGPAGR
ncbi:MAG: tRNA (adenosine(37)-N6)-threonylcarbamoyltransferase complex transferase subunit TsaD [Candidatus Sericytochromatia bacterium]|nr:tRNA (adenosine(37)-N6)-threonylcarbamoyltransferase complex transferase subunit TsaD [Candidatus Sericytochromatia bacterium]